MFHLRSLRFLEGNIPLVTCLHWRFAFVGVFKGEQTLEKKPTPEAPPPKADWDKITVAAFL